MKKELFLAIAPSPQRCTLASSGRANTYPDVRTQQRKLRGNFSGRKLQRHSGTGYGTAGHRTTAKP